MFLENQYPFSALGSSVLFPQASAKARLHFESTDLFAKAKKMDEHALQHQIKSSECLSVLHIL